MDHHRHNGAQGEDRAEHRLDSAEAAHSPGDRLSEQDQTLADNEQTLADRDQTQSDRDQQASEDDQQSADFDRDHGGELEAHRLSTAARAEAAHERAKTSRLRDRTAQERDLSGARRDELSLLRDEAADARDESASKLEAREYVADQHTLNLEKLRASARAARFRAADAREKAARDRAQAAGDRQHAAEDREQATRALEQAATDELTGARRRGVGLEELENEMQRARREGRPLVAAFVDIDGLKPVNDEQGHAAGDELLATVADGLRHHMRPYDLLVRLGGDEFLCVLPVPAEEARRRFEDLRVDLNDSERQQSVSVGFSELRDDESPAELIARADKDLLAHRGS